MLYNYIDAEISSTRDVSRYLRGQGVTDSTIVELDGIVDIYSETATQSQADAAIEFANPEGLENRKTNKIDRIKAKTKALFKYGFTEAVRGQPLNFPLDIGHFNAVYYRNLFEMVNLNPSLLPLLLVDLDGEAILIPAKPKLNAIANAARARMNYLYTNILSGDGSIGEFELIEQINAARNRAALSAIRDTRA